MAGTRPWGVREQGTLNPGRPLKQNEEVAKLKQRQGHQEGRTATKAAESHMAALFFNLVIIIIIMI